MPTVINKTTPILPELIKIQQSFDRNFLSDPGIAVQQECKRKGVLKLIKEGFKVGITVGSRGINDLVPILKQLIVEISAQGARPYFLAAMGSHGGACPQGQARIVSNAVRDELADVPVLSSMGVVDLGNTPCGAPVYFSRDALDMDMLVVVNRIKPHTDFNGGIESGLLKMLSIGLGKHKGAEALHLRARSVGLERVIREAAALAMAKTRIAFGLAIIENAYGRTSRVEALALEEFFTGEERLIKQARSLMPRLPFREIDLLILDRIGKDISGNGMDTNIVGRFGGDLPSPLQIEFIFVRGLSEATKGNAIGIGLADATVTCLVESIDQEATRINCFTSQSPGLGKVPFAFEDDRQALEALVKLTGKPTSRLRIVWIKDTKHLEECLVSSCFHEEIRLDNGLQKLVRRLHFEFDLNNNLISPL